MWLIIMTFLAKSDLHQAASVSYIVGNVSYIVGHFKIHNSGARHENFGIFTRKTRHYYLIMLNIFMTEYLLEYQEN